MKNVLLAASAAVVVLATFAVARSSAVDPSWISMGPTPSMGGRVSSLAVDPSRETHWLLGAAQGGVWETFDSGTTWTPRTDAQPSLAMGAIAFAPSNPQIVYAGTGEPHYQMSYAGSGILKSGDSGTSWQLIGYDTFAGTSVSDIRIDPQNPAVLVVSTVPGHAGRSQDQAPVAVGPGVFKSTDGGASWSRRLVGEATALVNDPSSFARQYAAIGTPWYQKFEPPQGATTNGLYRSLDGGESWTAVPGPWDATTRRIGRVAMAIAPSSPNVVYVSIEDAVDGFLSRYLGLWRTEDAWAAVPAWVRISTAATDDGSGAHGFCGWNDGRIKPMCTYAHVIAVHPQQPGVLFAGGVPLWQYDGQWRLLANGGTTPALPPGPPPCCFHGDVQALAFAGNRLIVGDDGGVFSTIDSGQTWFKNNGGLSIGQFWDGELHPTNPQMALGGVQDLARQIIWRGSAHWLPPVAATHDTNRVVISTQHPDTDWGVLISRAVHRTTDAGATFPRADTDIDWTGSDQVWTAALEKCPGIDNVVLTASDNLWKSTNFFSAASPAWAPNGPEMGTEVTAIAFAPSDASCNTYAFGTRLGHLRLTNDGGNSWRDLDPGSAVPNRYVTALTFDASGTTLLVALSGFDGDIPGQSGHVFKATLASPPSWVNVSPPEDMAVNTIVLDPASANVVYAGLDRGVWRSLDGGARWAKLGPEMGMPNVAVYRLRFAAATRQLVAFTHGRGAFRLSDTTVP